MRVNFAPATAGGLSSWAFSAIRKHKAGFFNQSPPACVPTPAHPPPESRSRRRVPQRRRAAARVHSCQPQRGVFHEFIALLQRLNRLSFNGASAISASSPLEFLLELAVIEAFYRLVIHLREIRQALGRAGAKKNKSAPGCVAPRCYAAPRRFPPVGACVGCVPMKRDSHCASIGRKTGWRSAISLYPGNWAAQSHSG
jgi:hypothetical protein